jgi:putative ABC transport system permease protein
LKWHLLESVWQDIRHALRMMRRAPGFTIIAVLSLALGIGANTAIFTLIDTLMLRLLPVQDPEQLLELMQKYPGEPRGNSSWTQKDYEHFRDNNHVFSGLTGFASSHLSVRAEQLEPQAADCEYVEGNFFDVLGVKPAIGRLIGSHDDSAVAVVIWSFWKNHFNKSQAVLGKQMVVQARPVTIIGVAPPQFSGLTTWSKPDIWLPTVIEPVSNGLPLSIVGRLKPGVAFSQAFAEMSVLYQFVIEETAKTSKDSLIRQMKIEIAPAGAGLSRLRDQFAKPLFVLMAVVGLILLITCTNIASLLLARSTARRSEMALRVFLGAGRFRLLRQALTESLLLSVAGSLIGVFLAYFGAVGLVQIMESGRPIPGLPPHPDIAVKADLPVLLFTAAIALLTSLLFGLAPAILGWTSSSTSALRYGGKTGDTRFSSLFGRSLVVGQVALSVVLLTAAGLFIRHLSNLEHIDLGFRRDHILLVSLDSKQSGYKPEQLVRSYQDLLMRLSTIPGVRSVAITGGTPLSGAGASKIPIVEGRPERPEHRRYISLAWAGPRYFETLGIPLLAGRGFDPADQNHTRVAIINQSMARYYFAGQNPLGKHIAFEHDWASMDGKAYEIIGIVGDAKYYEIREPVHRTVYIDAFQDWSAPSNFILRTATAPSTVIPAVRRALSESLKTIPISGLATMTNQVDASIVPERLIATLSGIFGGLGSLLAGIGLYGLLAYTVARRTNETGIRMALGATRTDMIRMVLKDTLALVCAGLVIGAPLALWSKRFAAGFIQDDLTLKSVVPVATGVLAIICIGLLAAYVPARRAANVEPMDALRYE